MNSNGTDVVVIETEEGLKKIRVRGHYYYVRRCSKPDPLPLVLVEAAHENTRWAVVLAMGDQVSKVREPPHWWKAMSPDARRKHPFHSRIGTVLPVGRKVLWDEDPFKRWLHLMPWKAKVRLPDGREEFCECDYIVDESLSIAEYVE